MLVRVVSDATITPGANCDTRSRSCGAPPSSGPVPASRDSQNAFVTRSFYHSFARRFRTLAIESRFPSYLRTDLVPGPRRLSFRSRHETVKSLPIGMTPSLGEVAGGAQSRDLLGNGGRHELVKAGALCCRQLLGLSLDRDRETKRVG